MAELQGFSPHNHKAIQNLDWGTYFQLARQATTAMSARALFIDDAQIARDLVGMCDAALASLAMPTAQFRTILRHVGHQVANGDFTPPALADILDEQAHHCFLTAAQASQLCLAITNDSNDGWTYGHVIAPRVLDEWNLSTGSPHYCEVHLECYGLSNFRDSVIHIVRSALSLIGANPNLLSEVPQASSVLSFRQLRAARLNGLRRTCLPPWCLDPISDNLEGMPTECGGPTHPVSSNYGPFHVDRVPWLAAKRQRIDHLLDHWRRIAPLAGRVALSLKDIYLEVTYRPGNQGAELCRSDFEVRASGH